MTASDGSRTIDVIARSACDGLSAVAQRAKAETIHSFLAALRIASRSLSSGAHSRDPLDRMTVHEHPSLRRFRRFPEHPRRRRESTRRAVRHLDLILPWQAEGTGHHVLHESIRAIHRA